MTTDRRTLTVLRPQRTLRRTVQQFLVAIIGVLLLLGVFVGYQVFTLRAIVLRMYTDIGPLLLSNETIALVERAAHVLRGIEVVLENNPEEAQRRALDWSSQLVALHSALNSNLKDLEAYIDGLAPDDPLQPPLARSWALQRETVRLLQEITQAVNHEKWDDARTLIRRFFTVYEEYHLAQRFIVRVLEERRDATLHTMLQSLRRILFQPFVVVLVSLVLVASFARFVNRRIIQRLEETAQGVLRFAEGDYGYRLATEEGPSDEVVYLQQVFNTMAERVQSAQLSLEQRVAERTYALQRRVGQIQAAADIARLLTSLRSPELLLERTARLIAERFGYYHVGIFLLDESGEWMELRAASSEGGQQMVARHHRLRVGEEGVVGFVARSGNPRIVLDVSEDPHYVRPTELALTRSEMALPLRVGGRVLGVLDIQSTQPNAFSPEDVTTLRVVADQLAVALDNAFLLQRMERALDELHWVQRQLAQRGWEEFLRVVPAQAYHRTARGDFQTLAEPPEALRTAPPPSEAQGHELQVPIEVREQRVAWLRLRRLTPWTDSEREMLHALAIRLGLALESARLYYVAQRRTAWLQAAVELGRVMRTWDETTLVAAFVRELLNRFPFWRAALYVFEPEERRLRAHAAAGAHADALLVPPGHAVPLDAEDPVARVARRREPLLFNTPEAMQAYPDTAPTPAGGARLLLPVLLGGELFGVLDLHAQRPRAFLEADLTVLRLLVDSLGVALLNARLVARLQLLLSEQQRLQHALTEATAAASVPEALDIVVQALYELEAPQAVAFYLPAESEPQILERVAARAASSLAESWPQRVRLDAEDHPVAQVFATGNGLWANQIAWQDGKLTGLASVLVVPLVYGDEILGVLAFQHARPNGYTEDFWGLAQTAANAVGSLLSNLRLLEQVRRRSAQLQLLYDFTVAISGHTHFDDLARDATARLRATFDALHAGLLLFDEHKPMALLVATVSRSPDAPGVDWQQTRLPLLPGVPLTRLKEEPRVWVVNYAQLQHAPAPFRQAVTQRGVRSQVFAPLLVGGEVIGAMALGFEDEEPPLGTSDLAVFEQLTRQLSLAIELTRLLETLERRAQRERWVREITVRMRASNDPLAIVRTALEGLREQLHLQEAQILLTRVPGTASTAAQTAAPDDGTARAEAAATSQTREEEAS